MSDKKENLIEAMEITQASKDYLEKIRENKEKGLHWIEKLLGKRDKLREEENNALLDTEKINQI